MLPRRVWLDWSEPCLPQAAEWLIEHANPDMDSVGGWCDLRPVVCVVPGQRAGRILKACLWNLCGARNLTLIPPRVVTPGALVDELTRGTPVASPYEAVLAWVRVLRRARKRDVEALLPVRPDEDDALAWRDLAGTIARVHEDIAAGDLDFADVAETVEAMNLEREADRWRVLERLHGAYLKTLADVGLADRNAALRDIAKRPNVQTSKLGDDDSPPSFDVLTFGPLDVSLVLIGIAELNALQRSAISGLSALGSRLSDAATADSRPPTASHPGCRVTALVHAPEEPAERFDSLGCVRPEAWRDARVDLDDDQIITADKPEDQAQFALRAVASFNGRFSASEITIGLGDESLASSMERAAEWAGLAAHASSGTPLLQSPPCAALGCIAAYLEDSRFAELAALLRHPDIERWLWRQVRGGEAELGVSDWLTLLDEYFAEHLQVRCDGNWLGDERKCQRMAAVYQGISRLLAPLSTRPQRMDQWAQPILGVLANLYEELAEGEAAHLPANQMRREALTKIRDVLAGIIAAPAELQPKVNAATAISLLLQELSSETLAEIGGRGGAGAPQDEQIEMLGWLELHLDPAPALIITGFNEGHIPASSTSDAFLPDSLRQKLGLMCNATRYARDAYLMEAIRHSRRSLTVIAGRRSARSEPLAPSRLLLACDDAALVSRVRAMCRDDAPGLSPAPIGLAHLAAARSAFSVPALPSGAVAPPDYLRITDFRGFLACPYRWALKRLLRLEAMSDDAVELDAMQFGGLAHEVLEAFGRDTEIRDCSDSRKIEKYLHAALERQAKGRFGRAPMAAVRVQIERLKQRLAAFAVRQAKECEQGWRIQHCEIQFGGSGWRSALGSRTDGQPDADSRPHPVSLDVPGQDPMPLSGKIDRIDVNELDGRLRILDYKTSAKAESPHKSHTGREKCDSIEPSQWKDLQLPLYRFLVAQSKLATTPANGEVSVGYFCLPKSAEDCCVKEAKWTAEQIGQAIDVARDVVRQIRAGVFEMKDVSADHDEFARICRTTAFMAGHDGVEEGEAAE